MLLFNLQLSCFHISALITAPCFMLRCGVLLDHGVFNIALQTLLDKDRKKFPNLRVPLIFQHVRVSLALIM